MHRSPFAKKAHQFWIMFMLSIRHNNYPDYLYKLEVLQHFGKSNNEKNECVSALTTAQLYNLQLQAQNVRYDEKRDV